MIEHVRMSYAIKGGARVFTSSHLHPVHQHVEPRVIRWLGNLKDPRSSFVISLSIFANYAFVEINIPLAVFGITKQKKPAFSLVELNECVSRDE